MIYQAYSVLIKLCICIYILLVYCTCVHVVVYSVINTHTVIVLASRHNTHTHHMHSVGPTGTAVCVYPAFPAHPTGQNTLNDGIFDIFQGDLVITTPSQGENAEATS